MREVRQVREILPHAGAEAGVTVAVGGRAAVSAENAAALVFFRRYGIIEKTNASAAADTRRGKEIDMDLTEKTLKSEEIYRGKIVTLLRDTVALPNGKTSIREVVKHPGGVGILALDEQNRVPMVTQYRYCMGQTLLEIPAGKREAGEDPFETAIRELKEEVGATASEWLPLGSLIASPGCYNEELWLYLARGLSFGTMDLDDDEFLDVERIPFDELVHRVMDGEIRDAKTVAAVLKAKVLLDR